MRYAWARYFYGLVLTLYPKAFREEFGAEMRLVFRELAQDPTIRPIDLAWRAVQDLCGGVAMLRDRKPNTAVVRWSAMFGCAVLVMWITGRTLHPGHYVGVPLIATPFLLFVLVGFIGARITKTFSGGLWAGFLTGLISAISVPGDLVLFHSFPFYDVLSFALSMAMAASFCMFPTVAGSFIANFSDLLSRARSGVGAFGTAWRQDRNLGL
jgi:hypothetical protein